MTILTKPLHFLNAIMITIVVGSGPAGTAAARTLADGGYTVLILEQGRDDRYSGATTSSVYQTIEREGPIWDVSKGYFAHKPLLPIKTAEGPYEFVPHTVGGGGAVNSQQYHRPNLEYLKKGLPLLNESFFMENG